ncbi:pilus assembly protein PilM [Vibrio mangrovi]|uniref:Competence protein A n=1 Tax=Vibrio mangrovi TaxID=474394 RepID=A0A1Y6IX46_9VIBR|nr:pilus assembly protein PilM [Vibrio mangrovi]MDW6002736.1 pilus assembly protein PilM [Vibrio mangrovi]SMS02227.1 Competence protein A [Vibrio mangrovi]
MRKFIVTGIDIRRHRVTAVTLKRQHNILSLLNCESIAVTDDIFSENEVISYQKIVNKLAGVRKRLPFFQHRAAISVPELAVMTRTLRLSLHDHDKSLESWLVYQAFSEKTSLSRESVCLDYVVLDEGYQVYAAKREVIESRLQAIRQAGLKPVLVDTEKQAFLQFLLEAMSHFQRREWLLLDVGEEMVVVGFISTELNFYRQFPFPGQKSDPTLERILQEVQRFLSLHQSSLPNGIWVKGSSGVYQVLSSGLSKLFDGPIERFTTAAVFQTSVPVADHLWGVIPLAAGSALRGLIALENGYAA